MILSVMDCSVTSGMSIILIDLDLLRLSLAVHHLIQGHYCDREHTFVVFCPSKSQTIFHLQFTIVKFRIKLSQIYWCDN